MNILGWAMINLLNAFPQRWDPFSSGNLDHRSFKKLLVFIPIFFAISGCVVLRSRYDLDGYCTDIEKEILHEEPHVIQLKASRNEDT